MDAVLNLLEKYDLEDPAEGKSRGEFENTTLAALYQNLTSAETNDVLVLNVSDHPETSVTTGAAWLLCSCTYPEGARDEDDPAHPPQPRAVA